MCPKWDTRLAVTGLFLLLVEGSKLGGFVSQYDTQGRRKRHSITLLDGRPSISLVVSVSRELVSQNVVANRLLPFHESVVVSDRSSNLGRKFGLSETLPVVRRSIEYGIVKSRYIGVWVRRGRNYVDRFFEDLFGLIRNRSSVYAEVFCGQSERYISSAHVTLVNKIPIQLSGFLEYRGSINKPDSRGLASNQLLSEQLGLVGGSIGRDLDSSGLRLDLTVGLIHGLPLRTRIMDVEGRQNSYNNGCKSCDKRALFVNSVDDSDHDSAYCFEQPHYVLGVVAVLFGLMLFVVGLGGIGRLWSGPDILQVGSGLVMFIVWLRCVYHGLGLIEFEVYPCPA